MTGYSVMLAGMDWEYMLTDFRSDLPWAGSAGTDLDA